MNKYTFALLIAINVAMAYGLWISQERIQTLTENQTTDDERRAFGEACVSWLRELGEKDHEREDKFYLGRSWKKHGQFVFEVNGPRDEFYEKNGNAICTYDEQSGTMYALYGASKERWMFY